MADAIKGVIGRGVGGICHFMSTVSDSQSAHFHLLLRETKRLRKAKQLAGIVHKASGRLKRDFTEGVYLQNLGSPLPTLNCSLRPPKDSKRFQGGLQKKELRFEARRVGTQEDFTCLHHLTEVLNDDYDRHRQTGEGVSAGENAGLQKHRACLACRAAVVLEPGGRGGAGAGRWV